MDKNMIEKIREQLSNPKELNKKQISVFLKNNILDDLDEVVKLLNPYSEKTITRNMLIELAVESLIENAPLALKEHKKEYEKETEEFNTVVFPSDCDGLSTFRDQKKWYYVRINKDNIPKIKYVAIYLGSPISEISYYGKVKNFEAITYHGQTRYIVYLDGDAIKLDNPVPLGSISPLATRSPKYTTLNKLKSAKEYCDLNLN